MLDKLIFILLLMFGGLIFYSFINCEGQKWDSAPTCAKKRDVGKLRLKYM
jgi:hypothetical protein